MPTLYHIHLINIIIISLLFFLKAIILNFTNSTWLDIKIKIHGIIYTMCNIYKKIYNLLNYFILSDDKGNKIKLDKIYPFLN